MTNQAEDSETCAMPRCRNVRGMTYYDLPLCDRCWTRSTSAEGLKTKLGIKEEAKTHE